MMSSDPINVQFLERARASSINELGRYHRRRDLADVAIHQGWPLAQFKQALLEEIAPATRAHCAVGLSESEIRQYSLLRILAHLASRPDPHKDGLEMEASAAVARQIGREPSPGGFFVPLEIQQRDLTAAVASAGGYLVSSKTPGSFIEALRARSVVRRMGATIIAGLKATAPIPRQTNTGTAQWLSTEASTMTPGDQSFGEVTLAPKTVGAMTRLSSQLALQSSPSVEAIVQADLGTAVALALDKAAINGSGASGEPLGLVGTSGIGTVVGTSLDLAKALEFQSDVLTSNAMVNQDACGYVAPTAIALLLAQRMKVASTYSPLWEGNLADGQMCGFPAMSSQQIPASHLIFGDWSQVLLGEWGILEIAVDPFTLFTTRKLQVRAMYTVDAGLRHSESFSVATAVT